MSARSTTQSTLGRSLRLFRAFLVEKTDPDHFYVTLAADSVQQVQRYLALQGCVVLDVGGGPGYFADAFRAAGAAYVGLESDVREMSARGAPVPGTILGTGLQLPIRDEAVDLCYSSNVLEHVARPWEVAKEMVRVTRPGGVIFMSFTNWYSPWGGHETSPWHYLGGERARQHHLRVAGHEPKNRYGESLFPVHVREALRWAHTCPDVALLDAYPRYHPWWAKPIVRVPGVREVLTWNLALVLRRR